MSNLSNKEIAQTYDMTSQGAGLLRERGGAKVELLEAVKSLCISMLPRASFIGTTSLPNQSSDHNFVFRRRVYHYTSFGYYVVDGQIVGVFEEVSLECDYKKILEFLKNGYEK